MEVARPLLGWSAASDSLSQLRGSSSGSERTLVHYYNLLILLEVKTKPTNWSIFAQVMFCCFEV